MPRVLMLAAILLVLVTGAWSGTTLSGQQIYYNKVKRMPYGTQEEMQQFDTWLSTSSDIEIITVYVASSVVSVFYRE